MKILKSDLKDAAQSGIISNPQAEQLWTYFESIRPDQAKFQILHVLYYFGGLLIFGSMSWFLTLAWDDGIMIMLISGLFAFLYVLVGRNLWHKENMKIPGGLLITAAVGLAPVFIYGLELATGFWPQGHPGKYQGYHFWIKGSWIFLEIGTIVAALIALRFYKFPFLTFPLAFALWYMTMDLVPLMFGDELSFQERSLVTCCFGLIVLFISYFVDKRWREIDFAFWTYLCGTLAFWGGLSAMESDSELNKLIYCLINIGLIFLSVYIRRKIFIILGTLGVFGYLGHLAWEVFKDSYALPIVIGGMGILIVYLGVVYQKNKFKFEQKIEKMLPDMLMKWRPQERA